ncbi:glycosyltransferase family 2 protein [Catenuloplanes atrovinosus]|uniref:Glycosyltransferase involved in cell wall biosynthesis n=1 Tax=Catenuloplanes atrovinosus TaxID=137266 RepID=A0AAE3YVC0_9ACTN|nr:glycosyltransferase [Catenuloplanes atrovinosus]MDR7279048.1 glycosyltransferase involved in cell wall biosynthesis [Catenuloplanes atrovinosus]
MTAVLPAAPATAGDGVRCGELELSGVDGVVSVVPARGEPVVRVLVRLHGEPLGYLTRPAGTTVDDLVADAWREFGPAALAHLTAEGAAPAVGERPAPAGPACPNRAAEDELVSVVVCTRDRAGQLGAALDRLARLTYPRLEIVIVDNAPSDDSTERLVTARARDDARFRYVREPRPGLSPARNRGLAVARGTYVAYTDDDVSVDPGWVHGLLRGFAAREDVACVTGLVCTASIGNAAEAYFDARNSGWSGRIAARLFDLDTDGGPLYPYSAGIFGTGANVAFHRERTLALGGFDEALGAGSPTRGGEDLDAFVRVLRAGYAIAYQPAAVVWHHHRADHDSLLRQLYGYGTGLTAYLTKLALTRDTRRDLLRRVPAGLVRVARIRRDTGRKLAGVAAPRGAMRREFAGYLAGPLLYLRARRAGGTP